MREICRGMWEICRTDSKLPRRKAQELSVSVAHPPFHSGHTLSRSLSVSTEQYSFVPGCITAARSTDSRSEQPSLSSHLFRIILHEPVVNVKELKQLLCAPYVKNNYFVSPFTSAVPGRPGISASGSLAVMRQGIEASIKSCRQSSQRTSAQHRSRRHQNQRGLKKIE